MRAPPLALLVLAGLLPLAAAAGPVDLELGERIVTEGAGAAVPACARCHGRDGRGLQAEAAPRIAGQSQFYLAKQLEDFAAGLRRSTIMAPIARALSPEQKRAAAGWYAARRDVPYPPQPQGDPALLQRGGALAAIGVPGRGVRACAVCHADGGSGLPPSFPYLAGQDADYTERQLRLWREGARRNDPLKVMAEIAAAMTADEMRAVALYFARVRPPLDSLNRPIPARPVPGGSSGS